MVWRKTRKVSNTKNWNEDKDILWGRKKRPYRKKEKLIAGRRGMKKRRRIRSQSEMRKPSRWNIGTRLDREGFKSITKLRSWLFPRHGAITSQAHLHASINRHETGIGIEAKREEKTNQEEHQQFWDGSHNSHSTRKILFSKWLRIKQQLDIRFQTPVIDGFEGY